MGLERFGAPGTTAAIAIQNDQVKKGGMMASPYVRGLLGYAPVMPVNTYSCAGFVNRGGRIPAPIHSFKN